MSSLFVAFCFSKNVSRNDKCISRTALYRINHNINKFREITFKGTTLYRENFKPYLTLFIYVTLVQTVLIFSSEEDYVLTSKNLLRRLKIISKKFSHILASDIEWTYVSSNPLSSSTTTNAKEISKVEFDEQLDSIEEKYATLTSQVPQKKQNTRQNINLHNSNNKPSNNKTTSLNFVDIISQVQKGTSSSKTAYTEQSSSTNNLVSTSQNTSQHIPSRATRIKDEEDATFVSNDDLTELVEVRIQEATPEIKEKYRKNLHSTKK
ncbi:hypothetical protein F8M41_022195 [Gigaspora margarita]|uniref:Uncharacterized protein n=1 Tax=Gigaspora margarita TaxID=4874 RepID=A0A8H4EID6_GIGMA|nr:hypothetical protein F8M41_022195 [Gigaspora margarita]